MSTQIVRTTAVTIIVGVLVGCSAAEIQDEGKRIAKETVEKAIQRTTEILQEKAIEKTDELLGFPGSADDEYTEPEGEEMLPVEEMTPAAGDDN